jgi:hypothetical protein
MASVYEGGAGASVSTFKPDLKQFRPQFSCDEQPIVNLIVGNAIEHSLGLEPIHLG